MKKIFFLFSCCFFFISPLFAQSKKIDSLEKILNSTEVDSLKLKIFVSLFKECNNAPDKALQYGNDALALAQKTGDKKNEASWLNAIGLLHKNKGNSNKALECHERALKISREIKDKASIAKSLNNLGVDNSYLGNYTKTLEYYFEALKIREEMGDKKEIAALWNNIGIIYWRQKNYQKSLEYHFKSLALKKEVGDKSGYAKSLTNIGIVYVDIANRSKKKKDYEKALDYYLQSLKIKKELGDKKDIASTLNNIGNVYKEQKNFSKAMEYHSQCLAIMEELGDKNSIAAVLVNMGNCSRELKQYSKALSSYEKSLKLTSSIGFKEGRKDAYEGFSVTYDSLKDYKNAYEYHKKYSDLKDSLLNEESSKQIAEMQTKYETEKKEQQINLLNKDKELQDAQLNRQKIVIWSVAGGLLVVLILSIFIFRERKKSEKLLLNILPVETARELKSKGKASPKYYESVTVMFTDFKGFTTIAEKLSAEELVSELDFLFKKFDEIISKYNIEKIKTIGDAYMCASGLPTPNTNHAEEIVKAGIEIQSWMKEQNNKWQLRIGIHSGSVTAGVVGDKKFAYDIWGDTVNTASRMESSGEPGKINISGATYQILQGFQNLEGLVFTHRGKIPAKNKGEIEMYFVESSEMRSIHKHN
ncbi:MAG: tetratricopeptide repeat protein [Bacteroidetes bacterium]|nr:tetratricopeptide repeat protein [Bacteroidota bacterium]